MSGHLRESAYTLRPVREAAPTEQASLRAGPVRAYSRDDQPSPPRNLECALGIAGPWSL